MDSNALQNILVENSAINAAANSNPKRIKKRSSKAAKKQSPVPKKLRMSRIKTGKTGEENLKSKEKQSSARSNSDPPLLENLDSTPDEVVEQRRSRNGCSPSSQVIDKNVSAEGKNRKSKKESKKKMAKNVENINDRSYNSHTNIAANSGDSLNVPKIRSKTKRKSRESEKSAEHIDVTHLTVNKEPKESITIQSNAEYNADLCSESGESQNNLQEANNKRNSKNKSKSTSQKAKNSDNLNNLDNNNSRKGPSPNIAAVTNTDDKNVTQRKKGKKLSKKPTKGVCKMNNSAQDNLNLSQNSGTDATMKASNIKGKKAGIKRKDRSEHSTTNLSMAMEKENAKKRRSVIPSQQLEQHSTKAVNLKPPGTLSSTPVTVRRNNMELIRKAMNPTKKMQLLNLRVKTPKVLKTLKNIKQKTFIIQKKKQILNRGRPAQINKRNIGINKNKITKASNKKGKIISRQAKKNFKADWRKKIAKKNKAKDKIRYNKSKTKKIKARIYAVKKKTAKK